MNSRLVLCLDGTWNSPFQPVEREDKTTVLKPTNPLKLSRAVMPVDSQNRRQLSYYDSGVGAIGLYPGFTNKLLNFFDSKLGGAWGAGFEANIEQAVTFLVMNYLQGDEIFVFGFSRGASQARALTHFVDWMGGLPAKNDAYYVPLFFRHYLKTFGKGQPSEVKSSTDDEPHKRIQQVEITFLGVWDTVMALGPRFRATEGTSEKSRSYHVQPKPPLIVKNAWQALAIDETRYDFRPEIWNDRHPDQVLQQRWFAGSHGNVGGSYGYDGLANIALGWVVNGAKAAGLEIDTKFLGHYRPYPQDEMPNSHTLLYKITEGIRFRRDKGVRSLSGHPVAANLSVDPSVFHRIGSDYNHHKKMTEPYRPQNVIEYLRGEVNDLPAFFSSIGLDPQKSKLPDDVQQML